MFDWGVDAVQLKGLEGLLAFVKVVSFRALTVVTHSFLLLLLSTRGFRRAILGLTLGRLGWSYVYRKVVGSMGNADDGAAISALRGVAV